MDHNKEINYPRLNLPPVELKTRVHDGLLQVFDPLRKKYVALTPEEYVRQHFTSWLINSRHYPASLTANEIGITLNDTRRRCDTVVFDRNGKPLIIVEYKAPDVAVTQDVFDQIVRYNMTLKAAFLVVSNGINHYCCKMDYKQGNYSFIPMIPDYHDLIRPWGDN